jgi:hypothetical protein
MLPIGRIRAATSKGFRYSAPPGSDSFLCRSAYIESGRMPFSIAASKRVEILPATTFSLPPIIAS